MGESLFGKLRNVMSREKTSDIANQDDELNHGASLARIGLATGNPQPTAAPNDSSLEPDLLNVPAQPGLPSPQVAPVGIQFFAELPSQESADEISSVSRRAENCLSTEAQQVDDGIWQVAVTLCMAPVPQEIHAVETALQTWAQKMGGTSKGWGLNQNQAA